MESFRPIIVEMLQEAVNSYVGGVTVLQSLLITFLSEFSGLWFSLDYLVVLVPCFGTMLESINDV